MRFGILRVGDLMEKRNLDRKGALNLTSVMLFVIAGALAVITAVMSTSVAEGGWAEFLEALEEMQNMILALPNRWLIVIAIMCVFMLKNFIPIPFPFIFMMTGVMFRPFNAVIINTAGFCLLLLSKYYWGRRFGGGTAVKNLKKYDNVREMMMKAGPAKLGILVALRLIPSIPVSVVSKIYGGMEFPVGRFMIASVIGFFPKIWTYSVMGGNISQPFTWHFMGPIVALLVVSGASTLIVNIVLEKKKGDTHNDENQSVKE